jgi:alkanesulfonate monooxygenase SsuD/methylene tetrahydromethanopterin reductase-like flavin-dependent oxidoreductase (luciferase family)
MKFGIFSTVTKADERSVHQLFKENLEQVEYAEELGFDSFWFAEHHFSTSSMIASPNVVVAAASQRTSRIKLGPAVNVLPFHHPIRLAEEGACDDFDELMDLGMLLVGSPKTCIEQIKRHQEFLGDALQSMILFFAYGNLTQKQVLNAMRLFAEEVMPEFTDTPVSAAVSLPAEKNKEFRPHDV